MITKILLSFLCVGCLSSLIVLPAVGDNDTQDVHRIYISKYPWQVCVRADGQTTMCYMPRSDLGATGWLKRGTLDMKELECLLSDTNNVTTNATLVGFLMKSSSGDAIKIGYVVNERIWTNVINRCQTEVAHGKIKNLQRLMEQYPPLLGEENSPSTVVPGTVVDPAPLREEDIEPYCDLYKTLLDAGSITAYTNRIEEALKADVDSKYLDDIALITLVNLDGNVGVAALTNFYRLCEERLSQCRLEDETLSNRQVRRECLPSIQEVFKRNLFAASVAKLNIIVETQMIADRMKGDKTKAAEVEEIERFVRESAKKLLQEFPKNEIEQCLERLQQNKH